MGIMGRLDVSKPFMIHKGALVYWYDSRFGYER